MFERHLSLIPLCDHHIVRLILSRLSLYSLYMNLTICRMFSVGLMWITLQVQLILIDLAYWPRTKFISNSESWSREVLSSVEMILYFVINHACRFISNNVLPVWSPNLYLMNQNSLIMLPTPSTCTCYLYVSWFITFWLMQTCAIFSNSKNISPDRCLFAIYTGGILAGELTNWS